MLINKWILGPTARCIKFVAEEAKIGGLLQNALTHIEMGGPLLDLLMQQFLKEGLLDAVEQLKVLLSSAPHQEQWAKELRAADYSPLNSHSTVAIWSAVEICIEDTIVSILRNDSSAVARVEALGVKAKLLGTAFAADDDQLRKIYSKLEDKQRVPGDVVATYEAVLNVFGLSAMTHRNTNALVELNTVRNCLVHRGGIVDDKAIREAPSLAALKGREILIARADFVRFHEAVSDWAMTLLKSIGSSPYTTAE